MSGVKEAPRPEEPLGPRAFNFDLLDDDDFELLGYLLTQLEHPAAVRVAAPDKGADWVLPAAEGGYERAWQAKRFTRNLYVAKCIESLDAAITHYGVRRYTFLFARDLTAGQEKSFDSRLRQRHPGVEVDYIGKSKLIGLLLESPEGERIANHFYGDPEADTKALVRALRAGAAPMEDAAEALARLGAVADYLDDHDPFFDYPTSSRPSHLPGQPLYPGSVGAIEIFDRNSVRRIEAIPRNAEALRLFGPEGRLEFDPTPEGTRAREAFDEAFARGGGAVEMGKGARLVLSRMPPAFAPFLSPVQEGGTFELRQISPPQSVWPATLTARTDRGESELDVDLRRIAAPRGWDGKFAGNAAGMALDLLLRRRAKGGQMQLNWRYDADETQALREQAKVLALIDVASGKGELVISDRSGVRPDLLMALTGRPVLEFLEPNRLAVGWLIEISDWLGYDLQLPLDGFTREEFQALAEVAHIVRTGQRQMNFDQITFGFPPEEWEKHRPTFESGAQLYMEEPLVLRQFNAEIGKLVGGISDIKLSSVREVAKDGGTEIEVVIEPASEEAAKPVFQLGRGAPG